MVCINLKVCPFFSNFRYSIGEHHQAMVKSYCLGALSDMCKRKKYEEIEVSKVPLNLCPSGYYSKRARTP